MAKKVIVLHSGGLDSTVCLYEAFAAGYDTISLGIAYGQRHIIEHYFAKLQCDAKGILRQIVQVSWTKPQRDLPLDRDISTIRTQVSPAFLPARNLVFLSIASAHSAGIGADEIWTGINSIDFSGYPDCTPEFFEAFSKVHSIGVGNSILRAPLLLSTKPQIAKRAKELGLSRYDTWSCYQPQVLSGDVVPCGRCDACKLHAYAWESVD